MDQDFTYRWIDWSSSPQDWERIDEVIAKRGWMKLSPYFSRILIAEDGDRLAGIAVLQMIPHTEPLFVAPEYRGTGLAGELSDQLIGFMHETSARGWMAVASNDIVAKECERQGMIQVKLPVYAYVRKD